MRSKVVVKVQGPRGIIKDAGSKAYRGLLGTNLARALHNLQERCNVTFSAEVKPPKSLFIVVYGLGSESDTVSDILVEHELYLQLPDSFDSSVRYQNPQSFSLPGLRATLDPGIPTREQAAPCPAKTPVLDTVAKSKVAELLDCATGPEEFREVQASHRLTTELKS